LGVLVGGREEPAQVGLVRSGVEQRPQVVRQEAQKRALLFGQPQDVLAVAGALDSALARHQSCCIVAQRP